MAHPKKDEVRSRYLYRCGYCGVTETDAGGELTVDHFIPQKQGGDDSDDNLFYCCIRCNQYKGSVSPNNVNKNLSELLLHPQQDDLPHHLRENSSGILIGLTKQGTSHIAALHLNREALIAHCIEQRTQYENKRVADQLLSENQLFRSYIQALHAYLFIVQNTQDENGHEDS